MKNITSIIFGLLLLISISAYVCDNSNWFKGIKKEFQTLTVSNGILNFGTMGKILKNSNLVKAVPNQSLHYPITDKKLKKKNLRQTIVRIRLKTDKVTRFQIFWAKAEEPYNEQKSTTIKIRPNKFSYQISIPNLKHIRKLRIDPTNQPANMYLDYIIFENSGYETISFHDKKSLRNLRPVNGIEKLTYNATGLYFTSDSNDPQFEVNIEPILNIESMVFQRKRQIGGYQYEAKTSGSNLFPSTSIIKPEFFKKNWPLLSIVIKNDHLYHPDKGIVTNKTSRGKEWERPAYISYFENGKERFSTMAGLRIHGGKRIQLFSSFRLYFRDEYGASEFKPGILFSQKTEPVKRLVVHHTAWPPGKWFFNNTLAYDIAKKIGCIVPEIKLCNLYLNGVSQGIYFLTPQLHERQLQAYFGHDNFYMHRFKNTSTNASKAFYIRHFWRTTNDRNKLKMIDVEKTIDLNNLTRHLFSFVFCGTTDFCQGAAVLDKSAPDAKLFWINWDMDHSFIDVHKTIFSKSLDREIWEQSSWGMIYKKGGHDCGRTKLFSRLMDEDPVYRNYVVSFVMDSLNHKITPRFLKDRLKYYESMLKSFGENDPRIISRYDDFLKNRTKFIRTEMQEFFDLGQSNTCSVRGPDGIKYEIDGYPEDGNYQGHYFKGSSIKVEVTSSHKQDFSYWLVNKKKVSQHPLIHEVSENTKIEPIIGKGQ